MTTDNMPASPNSEAADIVDSSKKKIKLGGFVIRVKYLVIGLIVGAVLGAFGLWFFQAYNPPDDKGVNPTSVVFERIVSINEMASASQNYSITEKASDSNKLFEIIEIPFTTNSFWYRYAGTLKAGVNLQLASYKQEGNTITVTLTNPYIISNTPNMEESGVLEENNNVLNPIHVEDVDAFQKECIEMSQSKAIAGGLLDEAKTNAETNIRNMFNAALGDEFTVEFIWQE